MSTTTAHVPTANASKYIKQLCRHWSHKLEIEQGEGTGTVRFPEAAAFLKAGEAELVVTVEANDPAVLERIKDVVSSHLDRFAFREAPLSYNWS